MQPWFLPGNLRKFELGPNARSTHTFEWRPESIYFQSLDGHHVNPPSPEVVNSDWYYTGASNPAPDTERFYINFYLFQGVPPLDGENAELIVTDVTFTPAALVAAPWARFAVARGSSTISTRARMRALARWRSRAPTCGTRSRSNRRRRTCARRTAACARVVSRASAAHRVRIDTLRVDGAE